MTSHAGIVGSIEYDIPKNSVVVKPFLSGSAYKLSLGGRRKGVSTSVASSIE